jgi:hypothetical protein
MGIGPKLGKLLLLPFIVLSYYLSVPHKMA